MRESIAKALDDWTAKAGCDGRVVLLTGERNFRKLVDPTYKSNRQDKPKPAALAFAKTILLEEHSAHLMEGLEADDLIGLMLSGSMAGGRGVAVSIDKDLRTVPGLHCNPIKGGVRSVGEAAANRNWLIQTMKGDPVDGFPGAPGIGPKKAEAALRGLSTLDAMWRAVVAIFQSVGQSREDAIRQARLARILRRGDYDKDTKEVLLWHPRSPARLSLADLTASPGSLPT